MTMVEQAPRDVSWDVASQGPESPMERLYRLHSAPLLRFLLRLTFGDRLEAEDMVQETLFRAWRYMQDHPATPEELRPWLFTVARRIAIDALRAKRARPVATTPNPLDNQASTDDGVDRLLVSLTLKQALMLLTPNHRRVIIEIFFHGRSYRETAEILDVPVGTVRSRAFYALRALARVIGHTAD